MNPRALASWLLLTLAFRSTFASELADLVADRAAVERIYYNHRLGTKPPFDQVLPREAVENLVRQDLHKEAVLKKIYGIEIMPAMLAAEAHRIDTTTRAPEVLAELKAALDNDTNRFAQIVARPIIVERLLREKFNNDDSLHALQRREMESIRVRLMGIASALRRAGSNEVSAENSAIRDPQSAIPISTLVATLKTNATGQFSETTWQLGPPPQDKRGAETPDEMEIRKPFGPNAQLLSSPEHAGDRKYYFAELPGELQNVLRVQLRRPGAVSAVIEMPGGFALYLCEERTPEALRVAALSVPKRSYEQWLGEQGEGPAARK